MSVEVMPSTVKDRVPHFDDMPEGRPYVLAGHLIALLVFCAVAVFRLTDSTLFWPGMVVGIVCLFGSALFSCIHAIARHTRFGILDVLGMVSICGLVNGGLISTCLLPSRDSFGGEGPFLAAVFLVSGLVFLYLARGFYYGLRLAMWLETSTFSCRTCAILLGVIAWPAHLLWRLSFFIAAVYLAFVFLLDGSILTWNTFVVLGTVAVLFLVARLHNRYRVKAQRRFMEDDAALGDAGRLVPADGAVSVFRLAGRFVGAVSRLFRR